MSFPLALLCVWAELRPLFTGQSRISVPGEDGKELLASAKSAFVVLTTDVLKSTTAEFTTKAMANAHIEADGSGFTVEVDGEVIPRVVDIKEAALASLRSTMASALREHLRTTQPRLGVRVFAVDDRASDHTQVLWSSAFQVP
jgi:protein-tyrosine-phosphatase